MGTHPIFESDFDCLTELRTMRAELCHFSGLKIYPGHGCCSIRNDGKQIRLLSSKAKALYHDKKNPRKLRWTLLYRRKNKKGVSNEASLKRRVRPNVKAAKAVAGLSYNELLAKKLHANDVSDATSKPQRPSLVCLTTNFWPRSNKSQRSVKSNETTQSRPPRKRKRLLKQTRQLPERLCQKQHPNSPLKCQ